MNEHVSVFRVTQTITTFCEKARKFKKQLNYVHVLKNLFVSVSFFSFQLRFRRLKQDFQERCLILGGSYCQAISGGTKPMFKPVKY